LQVRGTPKRVRGNSRYVTDSSGSNAAVFSRGRVSLRVRFRGERWDRFGFRVRVRIKNRVRVSV